ALERLEADLAAFGSGARPALDRQLLDDRVPRAAGVAPPHPLAMDRAAFLADIAGFGFRHAATPMRRVAFYRASGRPSPVRRRGNRRSAATLSRWEKAIRRLAKHRARAMYPLPPGEGKLRADCVCAEPGEGSRRSGGA